MSEEVATDEEIYAGLSPAQAAAVRRHLLAQRIKVPERTNGPVRPTGGAGDALFLATTRPITPLMHKRAKAKRPAGIWIAAAALASFLAISMGSSPRTKWIESRESTPTAPAPATPQSVPIQQTVANDVPLSSREADSRSGDGLDYLGMKVEAEEQLKAKLTDDHGVRFRDVHTRLSTLDGGGIIAFCGEVNSRTPLGGYGGFERFLASRSVAATESTMSADDFAQAWSRFCTDGIEGPKIWF